MFFGLIGNNRKKYCTFFHLYTNVLVLFFKIDAGWKCKLKKTEEGPIPIPKSPKIKIQASSLQK